MPFCAIVIGLDETIEVCYVFQQGFCAALGISQS